MRTIVPSCWFKSFVNWAEDDDLSFCIYVKFFNGWLCPMASIRDDSPGVVAATASDALHNMCIFSLCTDLYTLNGGFSCCEFSLGVAISFRAICCWSRIYRHERSRFVLREASLAELISHNINPKSSRGNKLEIGWRLYMYRYDYMFWIESPGLTKNPCSALGLMDRRAPLYLLRHQCLSEYITSISAL